MSVPTGSARTPRAARDRNHADDTATAPLSLDELIAAAKLGGAERLNEITTRRQKQEQQSERRPTTAEAFAAALRLVGAGIFVTVKDATAIMEYHGWRSNSRSDRKKHIAVKSAIYLRKRAGERDPSHALPINWSQSRHGLFAYQPLTVHDASGQPAATPVCRGAVPGRKMEPGLAALPTRAVVLTQNHDSAYDDQVGRHYHFPDIYRSQINSGDSFIYYRSGSPSYYFGTGRVGQIERDPGAARMWYARLVDYRSFPHQVAYKDELGRYLERRPDIKRPPFQRAVRRVDQETISRILRRSG